MQKLIYYPNFESTNLNWLKFALLYVDKLQPIIPPEGDRARSDLYRHLMDSTDLIDVHRPRYEESYNSTLDAIQVVETIMRAPIRYDWKFRHHNIVSIWQNPDKQEYKLYEQKFSYDWEAFCIENGFAQRTDGGVLISEALGNLYMTILANTIAEAKNISPITDKANIDSLSVFAKRKAPVITEKAEFAQSVISLKLPAGLSNIHIDDIINLRNSKNFRDSLKAFHSELESFQTGVENGTAEQFIERYNNVYSAFIENMLVFGTDATIFGLGVALLLQAPEYTDTKFFKEVVAAGAGLTVKSTYSLNKTWANTKSKRHCRRYIANLTKLPYSPSFSRAPIRKSK